jgi:hypothetical protein
MVFNYLLGLSIGAFQRSVFVSFGRDGQYSHKHDISNRLILVVQDTEWVQSYPLGTLNHAVRPDYEEHSGPVLSCLPAPADALAIYRVFVFSNV